MGYIVRFLIVLVTMVTPLFVWAVDGGPKPGGDPTSLRESITRAGQIATGAGLSSKTSATDVIRDVINLLLMLSALLAMGALVWGGIMYIMSLGNDQRAEKAKKIILYAMLGVVVVLLSYAIIVFIQTTLS